LVGESGAGAVEILAAQAAEEGPWAKLADLAFLLIRPERG
jgi:hypothetical protein